MTSPDDVVEAACIAAVGGEDEWRHYSFELKTAWRERIPGILAAAEAAMWRPIETAPEGDPILVDAPESHRGLDSCEVVVIHRLDDGEVSYWTNGGVNGGLDFDMDPPPTRWRPLPTPPASAYPWTAPSCRDGRKPDV